MASALFKLVLLTLLRRSPTSANAWVEHFSLLNDPPIARAFAEMASRLAADFSVQTLCRSVGLSRSAFLARFTAAFGESPMSVLRPSHAACGWPASCQCIVHRSSCTSRGVSEPQQLHLSEALPDRLFKLSVRSETRFVAYQIEEDGVPSDWGDDRNNAQIRATLDEL
jgi:AraC-like DNA-binding protein